MAADPLTKSTVDDLFNFDLSDIDDDLGDKPALHDTRDDKAVLSPRAGLKRKPGHDKDDDDLGLDQEVKIAKKRRPIAKLDEARLLSEPGIPKLRAISRSKQLSKKLRIKGKGHEFTDAARLLNHFQLWLDNLYPRAKFADALQLVEKAGHTKRMHIMRNEWINEGKPGYRSYEPMDKENEPQAEPDLFGVAPAPSNPETAAEKVNGANNTSSSIFGNGLDDDALFIPDANRPSQADRDDEPEDDELDALLAAHGTPARQAPAQRDQRTREDSEGEDDLDALLAEQDALYNQTHPTKPAKPTQSAEDDEDDLDALLAEQEAQTPQPYTQPSTNVTTQTSKPHQIFPEDDSDGEDDLSALLALQRRNKPTEPEPTLPTPQPTSTPPKANSKPSSPPAKTAEYDLPGTMFSSSPVPNNPEDVDLDDLEAMLASQEEREKRRSRVEDSGKVQTPRARKVREAELRLLSSSPVPNEDVE